MAVVTSATLTEAHRRLLEAQTCAIINKTELSRERIEDFMAASYRTVVNLTGGWLAIERGVFMNPQDFTILNIDDDEAGRYAKTRILQRAGYRVVDAGTGMDTFKIARQEQPQLILLDVMLPDINRLEVCRS